MRIQDLVYVLMVIDGNFNHEFLVAVTQLYKRFCPSVGPSVSPSVHQHELKGGKTSILGAYMYVCEGGLVCGWGSDALAHPSATIF